MPNVTGNTGPRPGNNARRSRNTVVNNASKNYPGGYQAPISSASAVTTGSDLATARYSYLANLAALRRQKGVVGQNFKLARQGAKSEAIAGMTDAVNGALTNGTVGSSSDLGNRAGVIAGRSAAVAAAEAQRAQELAGLKVDKMGAQGDYYSQVSDIQNRIAQEEMVNSITAFQNDQFDALNLKYKDILASLRDQKRGNRPRSRNGLNPLQGAVAGAIGSVQNSIGNVFNSLGAPTFNPGGGVYGTYGPPSYVPPTNPRQR